MYACVSIHTQVPFTIIPMSIEHSAIKLHLIPHNQGHAILEGKVLIRRVMELQL